MKYPWPRITSSIRLSSGHLFYGDKTMMQIADIYEAYDEAKVNKMLLDFDDLLLEAYYLLRDNDEIREKYQGSFQSIMVDEFQDTNPVQFEILRLLIREMVILILPVSG